MLLPAGQVRVTKTKHGKQSLKGYFQVDGINGKRIPFVAFLNKKKKTDEDFDFNIFLQRKD
tara:strand:- start:204 stop:386 length:183 start_codon:yes stop_codon:yes gene_type:complete